MGNFSIYEVTEEKRKQKKQTNTEQIISYYKHMQKEVFYTPNKRILPQKTQLSINTNKQTNKQKNPSETNGKTLT